MTRLALSRLTGALLLAGANLAAQAADFTFAGNLALNTDLARVDFSLDSAGAVSLWTDSYRDELNFDPLVAVFDLSGRLVAFNDDAAALRPGQSGFDAAIDSVTLAAGHYAAYVGASFSLGDPAPGAGLAQVFDFSGITPTAIAQWDQPSYSPNLNLSQKGSAWSLHVDGVSQAAAVPEPTTYALMLAGLLAVGWLALRNRSV